MCKLLGRYEAAPKQFPFNLGFVGMFKLTVKRMITFYALKSLSVYPMYTLVSYKSKKYGRDHGTIQSSSKPDPGYHMGQ